MRFLAVIFSFLLIARPACALQPDQVALDVSHGCDQNQKVIFGDAICPLDMMDITDGQLDKVGELNLMQTFTGRLQRSEKHLTLVVYFHGGLVDKQNALIQARQLDAIFRDHPTPDSVILPFYFVYNVGPKESILKGDRERGLFTEDPDIRAIGLINRYEYSHRLTRLREESGEGHEQVTPTEDGYRETANPLAATLGRNGMLAWSYMKQVILDGLDMSRSLRPSTAEATKNPCSSAQPDDPWPHIARGVYDSKIAGARQFVCMLGDLIEERHQQKLDTRIVLIGHSTGSIYITQMIRKMQSTWSISESEAVRDQKVDTIFLAPAVSYADFDTMLIEARDRINNIRIFTMDDAHESSDKMLASVFKPLAGLYPRSLLFAVSGIFEPSVDEPLLGLDRYRHRTLLATYHNYISSAHADPQIAQENAKRIDTIEDVCRRLTRNGKSWNSAFVLAPTPYGQHPPFASRAIDHGDFVNDPDTLESVRELVQLSASSPAGSMWPTAANPDGLLPSNGSNRYSLSLGSDCTS